jgi:hypothetical protein
MRDVTFSNSVENNGNAFGFLRFYGNDDARKTTELQRRLMSALVMFLFSLFSAADLQATEEFAGRVRSSCGARICGELYCAP